MGKTLRHKDTKNHREKSSCIVSLCLSVFLIVAFTFSAAAHEMRPAYLELHQTGPDAYDVLWKVPARGEDMRLGLYVQLPEGCSNLTEPKAFFSAGAYTERWSFERKGGLAGRTIHIAGLTATLTDVLVRVERLDGSTQVTRLTSSAPSFIVEAAPRKSEVAHTYLVLGISHSAFATDLPSCSDYEQSPPTMRVKVSHDRSYRWLSRFPYPGTAVWL